MRLAPRTHRLAAAAAALALASPAAAYVRSSDRSTGKALFWPMPVVPYHVSDAPSGRSPSCTAGPAGDPELEAVRSAFAAWRQGCASLELIFAGGIDEIRTGLDGAHQNLVVFRRGWCSTNPAATACINAGGTDCGNIYDCFDDLPPLDRSVVALTSALYDPDTGRIVNADIEVNGWDGLGSGTPLGTTGPAHGWYFTCDEQAGWLPCATYGQDSCFYIDLQNTLTHEVGHFLGLAHPCELNPAPGNCTPEMAQTTMYPATTPGDMEKRSLSPDDIAGVCDIYPSGGGCGCGSGGAPGAIAALLAALALRPGSRSGSGSESRSRSRSGTG